MNKIKALYIIAELNYWLAIITLIGLEILGYSVSNIKFTYGCVLASIVLTAFFKIGQIATAFYEYRLAKRQAITPFLGEVIQKRGLLQAACVIPGGILLFSAYVYAYPKGGLGLSDAAFVVPYVSALILLLGSCCFCLYNCCHPLPERPSKAGRVTLLEDEGSSAMEMVEMPVVIISSLPTASETLINTVKSVETTVESGAQLTDDTAVVIANAPLSTENDGGKSRFAL